MAEKTKRYWWLKLREDFFDQKAMKKLRKVAGGDTYTIIYLKMQLLSLRNDGIIEFEGVEDTFDEELALSLDEATDNVQMTLAFLKKHKLIEEVAENQHMLPEAVRNVNSESDSAARVRNHRERKQLETPQSNALPLQCNAHSLHCNTENVTCNTEKEKEIEIEKRDRKRTTSSAVAADTADDDEKIENIMLACRTIFGIPPDDDLRPLLKECAIRMDYDVVVHSFSRAKGEGKGWFYAKKILQDWLKDNVTCVDDVRRLDQNWDEKKEAARKALLGS